MNRCLAWGLAALVSVGMVGCGGPSAPVAKTTGTVTYKGNPVEGATVTMTNDDASIVASGVTDASGNFEMQTQYGGKAFSGAPIGPVKVTITKYSDAMDVGADYNPDEDPMAATKMMQQMFDKNKSGKVDTENEIPAKYASESSSGLQETIDADPAKNVFTFALED